MSSDKGDQAELEEKTRLINQVLELQHTLEDLSSRVDAVKEENLKTPVPSRPVRLRANENKEKFQT